MHKRAIQVARVIHSVFLTLQIHRISNARHTLLHICQSRSCVLRTRDICTPIHLTSSEHAYRCTRNVLFCSYLKPQTNEIRIGVLPMEAAFHALTLSGIRVF